MKQGDRKIIIDGLEIGLTCEIKKIKDSGSILVVLDDNNLTETHLPDYSLKDINIENALLALKNLRKFDKYKEERIEQLEEENNKLNNRIKKLLDAKF
jgi:transposase